MGLRREPRRCSTSLRQTTRFGLTWNSQVKLGLLGADRVLRPVDGNWNGCSPNAACSSTERSTWASTCRRASTASFFHQVDARWALLGSVGWQQWSKFGYVEVGRQLQRTRCSLTSNLDFKDTWHVAAGAQYQLDAPWRLDFGIAYDSEFQDGANVSPMLPTNAVWRFGVGAQKQESRTFSWGVAAEYAYGGTLDVNRESTAPVALGGRGDLVGSYNDTGVVFLTANFNWKF